MIYIFLTWPVLRSSPKIFPSFTQLRLWFQITTRNDAVHLELDSWRHHLEANAKYRLVKSAGLFVGRWAPCNLRSWLSGRCGPSNDMTSPPLSLGATKVNASWWSVHFNGVSGSLRESAPPREDKASRLRWRRFFSFQALGDWARQG